MTLRINRSVLLAAVMALGGVSLRRKRRSAVKRGGRRCSRPRAQPRPADKTSILKLLTKNVTIGSTVDAKNGDMGPRAVRSFKTAPGS